jgi:prevent-host-death family protein
MSIKIVPISDLRRQASDVINTVRETKDPVYITQHGRPAVVIVDYERYEQMLQDLEDLSDQLSLQAVGSESTRPLDEFLAEMQLDDSD